MNSNLAPRYRRQNQLHTFLLLAGMLLLLSLIGWLVAGSIGVGWALAMGVVLIITAPRLSPRVILYLYNAHPVAPHQLTQLNDIISWLANRGELSQRPQLYYIPSSAMLAFSVGMQNNTAIAISDGLLRELTMREMAAVLAHEISHIHSKDLWVMAIADTISRVTSLMALTGYLMLVFYIPVFVFQDQSIPWLLMLLLVIAPSLSALMQLALSRTREFSADMQAANLTGDPKGLISALSKIDYNEKRWLKQLMLPNVRTPNPSLLRTHPLTEERIQRLQDIAQDELHPFSHQEDIQPVKHQTTRRAPRHHIGGLWY